MNSSLKIILIAALSITFLGAGCAKKQQKAETDTTEQTAQTEERAPEQAGTKTAEGAARETLLALRRVHFAVDKDEINEESKKALTTAANGLQNLPKVELYVDGHADQTGTTEYNLQLGERRAKAVKTYLQRSGVDPKRLHIVSFGQEKPLQEGSDSESLAANRRVEFRLMSGDVEIVLEEGTPVN